MKSWYVHTVSSRYKVVGVDAKEITILDKLYINPWESESSKTKLACPLVGKYLAGELFHA